MLSQQEPTLLLERGRSMEEEPLTQTKSGWQIEDSEIRIRCYKEVIPQSRIHAAQLWFMGLSGANCAILKCADGNLVHRIELGRENDNSRGG